MHWSKILDLWSELQQEIYALKQDTWFVTDFYSVFKPLWEKLELYLLFLLAHVEIDVFVKLWALRAIIMFFFTLFDF
jgi:hypothetical protein